MAKSKPKSKDHDDELPEKVEDVEVEEAGAEVVEDADVEEVEDVEDADIEEVDADAEDIESVKADGDDGDDEPADSVDEGPKPPRPRLTRWQIALIALNWLAIPAFAFVAWKDYTVRMEFSYRIIANYIQLVGLPLRQEEDFPSLANETRRKSNLSREEVANAYKTRPGVNKAVKDFAPVDEAIPYYPRPSDMVEPLLKDIFRDLPNPVATQEDEIDRLKADLPKRIADAADEALKATKDADAKRLLVRKTLYPIIGDARWKGPAGKDTQIGTWEIDKVNDRLLKATDPELDGMVKDSVQRRIYWDILAPLNLFRPGDVKAGQIERMGDLSVTIDDVKGYLLARLDAAIAQTYDPRVHMGATLGKDFKNLSRDSIEKRRKIAFILFTLGQVGKPGLNEKLVKKGIERAQTISGLYDFTNATIDFVKTVQILEGRLAQEIHDDRSGPTYKTDKNVITRNEGFIDLYEQQIDNLVRMVASLETAQLRLADLKKSKDKVQITHDQRTKQFSDTMDKLLKERANTAKYISDLRQLQSQLHKALVELSDAAVTNLRILDEITAIESEYIRKTAPKGGKK